MDYENGNGPNPYLPADDRGSKDDRYWLFRDSKLLMWLAGCYPVFITLVYLVIGFWLDMWHPGWMLFLTIPLFYSYYHVVKKNSLT